MNTSTQYSMRWDNFSSHFTSEFGSLRNDEQFVDVTLCCDDQFIKAHKVILSACSPYFKKILTVKPHRNYVSLVIINYCIYFYVLDESIKTCHSYHAQCGI